MSKPVTSLLLVLVISMIGGCTSGQKTVTKEAITVRHIPNPTDIHFSPKLAKKRFPYMWYYRTEVINNLDRPVKIVRFEAFSLRGDKWIAGNILNRPLTSEIFTRWYTEGDAVKDGWIQPGATAACDPNWHGFSTPRPPRIKWMFKAIDKEGNMYQAESEIKSIPIEAEKDQANKPLKLASSPSMLAAK